MGSIVSECLRQALVGQAQRLASDSALPGCRPQRDLTAQGARDPEELLRVLMTNLFPRIAGNCPRPGDAESVADLLCDIGPIAGHSLRFLDAFNNFWKFATARSFLASAARWPTAAAAYALALDTYLSSSHVDREMKDWRRSFDPLAWPPLDEHTRGPVRKVLVLADNPRGAWRILREVANVQGIEAHVLICRSGGRTLSSFIARQAAGALLAAKHSITVAPSMLRGQWTWIARPLHDETVIRWIKEHRFEVGLHGMGEIYRQPVLNAFRLGILNSHIGHLPGFRGRSVVEWSLLADAPLGATVFFIDEGIDTGERLILWRPAPTKLPSKLDDLRRSLFHADGRNYAAALEALKHAKLYRNEVSRGWRFYIMSDLLRDVAQQALDLRRAT